MFLVKLCSKIQLHGCTINPVVVGDEKGNEFIPILNWTEKFSSASYFSNLDSETLKSSCFEFQTKDSRNLFYRKTFNDEWSQANFLKSEDANELHSLLAIPDKCVNHFPLQRQKYLQENLTKFLPESARVIFKNPEVYFDEPYVIQPAEAQPKITRISKRKKGKKEKRKFCSLLPSFSSNSH